MSWESLAKSAWAKTKREGLGAAAALARENLQGRKAQADWRKRNPDGPALFDVMFINGCDYSVPHPIRYRVDHQIEQLQACGLGVGRVDAWNLNMDHVTQARCFIIFRCPYTEGIGAFIRKAKSLNKQVFFDIDDLVVDRRYTDTIAYLDTMSYTERQQYDDGVDRMGQTLKACGAAITTTEALARELGTIVPHVFVNRNTASEDMVFYSERAVYERDVLPELSPDKVPQDEQAHWKWACQKREQRSGQGTVIGYFSGSITHNSDFEMILPALAEVMRARPDVRLRVVGELDIPEELEPFGDRIEASGFCPWERLPDLIAGVDINIVPLTQSVFNEAKSENKWVEASLVKVPTVASNVGAFAKMVRQGETGLLCDGLDEWGAALLELIDAPDVRRRMAQAAYDYCHRHCTTVGAAAHLGRFIKESFKPNALMVFPSLDLSGGVLVALRHCAMLQQAGWDVSAVDNSLAFQGQFVDAAGTSLPVLKLRSGRNADVESLMHATVDLGIATMWTTVEYFDKYFHAKDQVYLVQNYEPDFYEAPDGRRREAHSTYVRDDIRYVTISTWCKSWLAERYGHNAAYAPNGIDADRFAPAERDFGVERIRILVEGDSGSYYKNVDEAFRVVDRLDPERFEVWYVSYNAGPKQAYRVDKFLNKVPHDEMPDVYRSCHILLKTSILESFSYPPLEMMATGGYVVAVPNEGNAEYLVDEQNCLLYPQGDIQEAVNQIERIVRDAGLRARLVAGGRKTADEHSWDYLRNSILALYAPQPLEPPRKASQARVTAEDLLDRPAANPWELAQVNYESSVVDAGERVLRFSVLVPFHEDSLVTCRFADIDTKEPLGCQPILLGSERVESADYPHQAARRLSYTVRLPDITRRYRICIEDALHPEHNDVHALEGGFFDAFTDVGRQAVAHAGGDPMYAGWFDLRKVRPEKLAAQRALDSSQGPSFGLVVVAAGRQDCAAATIDSIAAQSYANWKAVIVDDGGASVTDGRMSSMSLREGESISGMALRAAAQLDCDYLVFVARGDVLEPDLLFEYAQALGEGACDAVFCDQDDIDDAGRLAHPWLKPAFGIDLVRSINSIGRAAAFRACLLERFDLLQAASMDAFDYDLALQVAEHAKTIAHVERVLYHARQSAPLAAHAQAAIVQRHLDRLGVAACAEAGEVAGLCHVAYQVPEPAPSVTVVLAASADYQGIQQSIEAVIGRGGCENIEIALLDGGRFVDGMRVLCDGLSGGSVPCRSLDAAAFSQSVGLEGALDAAGDYLLFLGPGMQAVREGWVSTLLGSCARDGVGAVGGMVLAPDMLVEHAGLSICGSAVAHLHRGLPRFGYSYRNLAVAAQDLSAVDGACLMVEKQAFAQVGGFDAFLPAELQAADLCLKLRECGWRVVYEPFAELRAASASEGSSQAMDACGEALFAGKAKFRGRWAGYFVDGDPFQNWNIASDDQESAFWKLGHGKAYRQQARVSSEGRVQ